MDPIVNTALGLVGTAGTGKAATVGKAIKASGAIVKVAPDDFVDIVSCQEKPLVIHSSSTFWGGSHRYLCSFKGFTFYTKSNGSLNLPADAAVIEANKIWIPG